MGGRFGNGTLVEVKIDGVRLCVVDVDMLVVKRLKVLQRLYKHRRQSLLRRIVMIAVREKIHATLARARLKFHRIVAALPILAGK